MFNSGKARTLLIEEYYNVLHMGMALALPGGLKLG